MLIEWGTWLAVAILGPGSVAVFIWFLLDLKRIMPGRGERDHGG